MKTHKLASIIVTALFFAVIYPLKAELQLSAETVGAIKYPDFAGKPQWGAGADIGLKFNKYVTGHARLLAYESENWGGTAIDEASALVEAKLLSSANGKLSLSAIGGGHHDFQRGDWGFGVGARAAANIYGPLSLFGQSEVRAWFNGPKDLLTTAGLQVSF